MQCPRASHRPKLQPKPSLPSSLKRPSEIELGEYCRRKGLYPEQIKAWRQACINGQKAGKAQKKHDREHARKDKKRIQELERELRRKDKALAETEAVQADARTSTVRPRPRNALSETERQAIVTLCNSPAYAHLPPSQIVPRLADQQRYLASEATFHRVLRAAGQQQHRGRSQRPQAPRGTDDSRRRRT